MILENVAFLAAITERSQAYIQAMKQSGLLPEKCIVFAENKEVCCSQHGKGRGEVNLSKSLLDTLEGCHIPFEILEQKDINSPKMRTALQCMDQEYIVYSGYGGYILKPHLFEIGKKFLHVHAGILPQYRGSTTVYYSMLQDGFIGATAFFLNERIDEGDIVCQETFSLPAKDVDIDYVYEPWVRGQVLVKALQEYARAGAFPTRKQKKNSGETYYIIHPVLKHLALMKRV